MSHDFPDGPDYNPEPLDDDPWNVNTDTGDEPMSANAIERRQNRAYRAALAYTDDNDMTAAITDLIADLLHLADQYEGSEAHLQSALMHYRAETVSEAL